MGPLDPLSVTRAGSRGLSGGVNSKYVFDVYLFGTFVFFFLFYLKIEFDGNFDWLYLFK